jgi:hypothetical protein
MVERKLAVQGIVEGLDLDNPIGMDPDTYASVQKYTGFYTPLLQSIASVGDLALRGLNTAAYGVAGAAGDIVGDERLTRDLKGMYQMPFFGAGAAIPKGKLPTSNVRKVDATRVDNLPIRTPSIDQGLFYNIGKTQPQYADTTTNIFPVVKKTQVPFRKAAVDSARSDVARIQKFEGRDPKLMIVKNSLGETLGTMYEGGRKINLPLSKKETSEGLYRYSTVKKKLEESKELIPGIETYAMSSTAKPFGSTVPVDKLETILLNMKPEQRKLIFKRLLDPSARKEILRTFPEIQGAGITLLTSLSSIATASAIKKKD